MVKPNTWTPDFAFLCRTMGVANESAALHRRHIYLAEGLLHAPASVASIEVTNIKADALFE